ncbi:hypothetical protein R1sor_020335 [Riccia sorocarpa]|uniref:Uncharacterized protein n=1 Tax=Riccia sorocarpa TaxID=122646 RepID=A0ABD3IF28_9MARC
MGSHERTLGIALYLEVVADYVDIWSSPILTIKERIVKAVKVLWFFKLWRLWITHGQHGDDIPTLKENFISSQCFIDVTISCHFVVILVKLLGINTLACQFHFQVQKWHHLHIAVGKQQNGLGFEQPLPTTFKELITGEVEEGDNDDTMRANDSREEEFEEAPWGLFKLLLLDVNTEDEEQLQRAIEASAPLEPEEVIAEVHHILHETQDIA